MNASSFPFLDCSHEQVTPRSVAGSGKAWLAADIRESDWLIPLDRQVLDEIDDLAVFINTHPVQQLQRRVDSFSLQALRQSMDHLKAVLDEGVGFAVLDRLVADNYDVETLQEIYWLVGQLVGRPVAQKWDGEMIYDVRDTGTPFQYGVRGSRTAVELLFHTDNAFGQAVPDYVGLLCRTPAKSGGVSRFCSLYTLHQRLEESYPRALARLYEPMLYDRQKEHHEQAPPVCYAPFFSWKGERLNGRANTSLVRKGYEVAGQIAPSGLVEALDIVDEVCAGDALWFEAPLEAGQIQYLNNHEVGHYRSAFVDFDKPEQKRHLFRLWHRNEGAVCYDGVSAPA